MILFLVFCEVTSNICLMLYCELVKKGVINIYKLEYISSIYQVFLFLSRLYVGLGYTQKKYITVSATEDRTWTFIFCSVAQVLLMLICCKHSIRFEQCDFSSNAFKQFHFLSKAFKQCSFLSNLFKQCHFLSCPFDASIFPLRATGFFCQSKAAPA